MKAAQFTNLVIYRPVRTFDKAVVNSPDRIKIKGQLCQHQADNNHYNRWRKFVMTAC